MFFFLPLNTDAPIYYWPWVTLSLVILNTLIYFAAGVGIIPEDWSGWILTYGNGLHPLEWLSCNFVHFGFFHLLFNMIFLWGFGLVVEGKLGWWKYLIVYLGMGIVYAFGIQVLMLGYDGFSEGAGGASGVIYGLLAISMVWAPKNEVSCIVIVWVLFLIRIFTFELTILTFAGYYLASQVFLGLLEWSISDSFVATSEILHLAGAFIGFGVGVGMLKMKWVDCENWDLFAVWKGTYGNNNSLETYRYGMGTYTPDIKTWAESDVETSTEDAVELSTQRSAYKKKMVKKLRQFIQDGKPGAALSELRNLKHMWNSYQLPQPELRQLIQIIWEAENWTDVVPLMEEFLARFPGNDLYLELTFAGIVVQQQQRPRYALRILKNIPFDELTENQQEYYRKVERRAQKLIDQGTIELEGQSWS